MAENEARPQSPKAKSSKTRRPSPIPAKKPTPSTPTAASKAPKRTHAPRAEQTLNESFQKAMVDNLYFSQGAALASAGAYDYYMALSATVRQNLLARWRATTEAHYAANPKFVYYLSAEYLLGKQLPQNLAYTDLTQQANAAIEHIATTTERHTLTLADCIAEDPEPGLGNGGLGRLAACFLDSLATLNIPAVGYGIRYEYGIFRQHFEEGWQSETADEWALREYPWELRHSDNMVEVHYGGHTEVYRDESGRSRVRWVSGQTVRGEPYYILIPGYKTDTVNMLRLWRARANRRFDFTLFDTGDYLHAVEEKSLSESISKVLYPNDSTQQGRELRLKQQYFFVACSLSDIVRRFHIRNSDWDQFPNKVVMQLNDTHPVIAIAELMRILMDEQGFEWERAWAITVNSFAYTCHTLLPEALERWPVYMFERLLPRHLQIIFEINQHFLDQVRARFPGDEARARRMSIIDEDDGRQVRMAHLAVVGSFSVNGVAEIHSQLLRERTLADFGEMWPEKFNNKTNGVTPRTFVMMANPALTALITDKLGQGWLNNLEQLSGLERYVGDAAFQTAWRAIKRANKQALADYVLLHHGVSLDTQSMFDIMVKRLHEYKRQLLKALHIITLYHRIKDNPKLPVVPRTFIFGGKSAPGYRMAKRIIKLINSIGAVVNQDPDMAGRLKVIFLENFNVTLAQQVYPAADLSEQISLAGKEASGTGNMKFALNGAVTIGTLDGANIEIRNQVGPENFFLFGLTVDEVFQLKSQGYHPREVYRANPELKRCIDAIASGAFSQGDPDLFRPIVDSLLNQDEFMVLADYQAYIDCQMQVDQAYADVEGWTRMSILNTIRCGFFSSDRAIREYCEEIWKVKPV